MRKIIYIFFLILFTLAIGACESEKAKQERLESERKRRAELAIEDQRRKEEEKRKATLDSLEREQRLEEERKEKAIYDKYINNSLRTGTTPYSYCYGSNKTCSNYGCSQISVRTPSNSDVIVTLKSNEKVVRHAFIKAGSTHTFEIPNGTYQPFFYYGKGWNPEKDMVSSTCSKLKGGFISNESFGKDNPQHLSNNILEYELILTQHGNFSTKPSNPQEAF